ncbi:tRNA(Ile)-lysidine synthase [Mycoplasma testudineum]|uniref:tRNA(Ile)-lysidine synthase n=1 Tax=Mycoplasma testudineum TaxID=244584 RepID=A0A4R6ICZ5_9MOLU|nr:tRNA lysidine(34) synthetase TilS [Mycoplasma testudineum]OYD26726.1 tRNA lysidine(34) synthetase TilS [Mycoplasma testudineum]TDO19862.1 tRNA(Ile)-lysidine synthase [Mycoplasma testudineum]
MKKNKQKILLAVSGGPDSMYLLNKFKNQNIEVAHVNYNMRDTAYRDQKIVENFCNVWNIKFRLLKLNPPKDNVNFQSWARKKRYDFFSKIYTSGNFDVLMTGHHLDDKIATFLFQKNSKRKPIYKGINKVTVIQDMLVIRPLLKLSKQKIINYMSKNNIDFGIDESNENEKYTRNKNNKILKRNTFLKYKLLFQLNFLNFINFPKRKKIQSEFQKWKNTNYLIASFDKFKYQKEIIFSLLSEKTNVKISENKLEQIVNFINSQKQNNKEYLLNENYSLLKKNKTIQVFKK